MTIHSRRLGMLLPLLVIVPALATQVAAPGEFAVASAEDPMDEQSLKMTLSQASSFARLALRAIQQEYPNKPEHVMNGAADIRGPRALHPAFYGSFDWHSAVHGHRPLACPPVCVARRWQQDAAWLGVATDFARVADAETILVWSFGTFVPGGSFLDFGNGTLAKRGSDGQTLSPVGQAFARLRERE